jgi:hypothetical protein
MQSISKDEAHTDISSLDHTYIVPAIADIASMLLVERHTTSAFCIVEYRHTTASESLVEISINCA